MRRALIGLIASTTLAAASAAGAQTLGERFKQFMGQIDGTNGNESTQPLPATEVASGLRAALAEGASVAVTRLGRADGFWGDPEYRIPLPGWMQTADSALRSAGLDDQMQSFHLSLNRAAEQATAEAGPILRETINSMSLRDAYDILQGSETAATQYLREQAGEDLAARFKPIIANTTAQSQAVARYDALTSRAQPMLQFVPGMNLDLDQYVTQRALDGLFAVIAAQEREFRANPAAAGSAIVQKVFSNAG